MLCPPRALLAGVSRAVLSITRCCRGISSVSVGGSFAYNPSNPTITRLRRSFLCPQPTTRVHQPMNSGQGSWTAFQYLQTRPVFSSIPCPSVRAQRSMSSCAHSRPLESQLPGDHQLSEKIDGELWPSHASGSSHEESPEADNGAPGSTNTDRPGTALPYEDSGQSKDMDEEQEYANDSDSVYESGEASDDESEIEEVEEEHVPLTYQIPPHVLRAAMQAPAKSEGSYYSYTFYRGPQDERILLHHCHTMEIAERVCKYFVDEKLLGFDIEWNPYAHPRSIKGNVSLIQIASESRIALFPICLYKGTTAEQLMPATLKTILESPDILKVGVNIKNDFTRVEKYLSTRAHGKFELSRLHNLVQFYPAKSNNKVVKLSHQTVTHLMLPLKKDEDVRVSDWSAKLSAAQMRYAATDAYVGLRIFDALEAKRKKLRPIPPQVGLTDFDPPPKPRTAKPAKRVPKATAKAAPVADAEEQDEDDEAYETAAEEFDDAGEEREDDSSESQTSLETETVDPDGDYVPTALRADHDLDDLRQPPETRTETTPTRTKRVGRLRLIANPEYPKLPSYSSQGQDTMNEDTVANDTCTDEDTMNDDPVANDASMEEEDDASMLDASSDSDTPSLSANDVENTSNTPLSPSFPSQDEFSMSTEEEGAMTDLASQLSIQSLPSPPQQQTSTFPSLAPDAPSHSPEYALAHAWASTYLTSTIPSPTPTSTPSRLRANASQLRAYHLWYFQRLAIDEVCRHLRDPPLARTTVCGYICQAVSVEKLEYRGGEMRGVLEGVPGRVGMVRFRGLWERVGRGSGG
ncbi:hypothetical protein EJ04DRAFT_553163 [Polyplosphaeria fusca]|uniref:3'-5' exonuclease domain-containing protein n=1 Tax=Polyplosphaeria fusca TaxID=682080 RepID=A0A9P4QYA4_9PLEO|nr:hypothetical protein EJ04DRAFT_553163 [Polyplosphaeria fusca]